MLLLPVPIIFLFDCFVHVCLFLLLDYFCLQVFELYYMLYYQFSFSIFMFLLFISICDVLNFRITFPPSHAVDIRNHLHSFFFISKWKIYFTVLHLSGFVYFFSVHLFGFQYVLHNVISYLKTYPNIPPCLYFYRRFLQFLLKCFIFHITVISTLLIQITQ